MISIGITDRLMHSIEVNPQNHNMTYATSCKLLIAGSLKRSVIASGCVHTIVRYLMKSTAAGLAFILLTVFNPLPARAQTFGCGSPTPNPIVCENSKSGNPQSEWDISGYGDTTIQGFTTDISVNAGQTISFKINSAKAYTINIYRLGYYNGMGARKVATVPATPQAQPNCIVDNTTGLFDCGNWAVSASWAVPSNATSGIYIALLTRSDTGGKSHIVFVVRNDMSQSDLLFQTSDTTWQAYNWYGGTGAGSPGGGKSLYGCSTNPWADTVAPLRGPPRSRVGDLWRRETDPLVVLDLVVSPPITPG
jgi:hypothetical protein